MALAISGIRLAIAGPPGHDRRAVRAKTATTVTIFTTFTTPLRSVGHA